MTRWTLVFCVLALLPAGSRAELRFNRDIRPILADKCFHCHGADEAARKAKLRLDTPEGAYADRDGFRAVVPGDAENSELIYRIFAEDDDEVMPPPDSPHQLSDPEKQLLNQWVREGGSYEGHWAFQAPQQAAVPDAGPWGRNPIDGFVQRRLAETGLTPREEAGRDTLIRRLSLDLIGLAPTPGEVDAFLADPEPDAYERLVDRLLSSPHYGERMAMWWLDGARYADTHGFQADWERYQWPWRDWVIKAFNSNQPFDRFTIEQLAGDLLPNPTNAQVVATGFNRNHRINTEGGALAEEWHVENVIDRLETTGTVWMALTFNCCRCHDHKYDPISQKEFYQFYAFFNNVPERGFEKGRPGNFDPVIPVEEPSTRAVADLEKKIAEPAKQRPTVMVMREMEKPRDAFVLKRGEYDQRGEKVTAGLPAILPPMPGGEPMNRLGLARWLVNGEHPLTARVQVNRLWEVLFGTGLVKSGENFGTQADWPSHPDLLDWLAVEFVNRGWDVKAMLRLMVTSATYRQSTAVDAPRLELDPANRLLSRGPRFRLQAELIRDQALAVSGLLNPAIGGPSVRPYQPAGIWSEFNFYGNLRNYKHDTDGNQYRRSLYTIWKRTAAPPAMTLFDMGSREVCTVRRSRSNTPLQALALMNDVTYLEAARVLAEGAMTGGGPEDWIRTTFRRATARDIHRTELDILTRGYHRRLDRFRKAPSEAVKLLAQGEAPVDESLDPNELAALTTVASLILNLDEVVTRE
jgi:hypothetical protein